MGNFSVAVLEHCEQFRVLEAVGPQASRPCADNSIDSDDAR